MLGGAAELGVLGLQAGGRSRVSGQMWAGVGQGRSQSRLPSPPRSPIEKSLYVAITRQVWEESSPLSGLGIAVSGGAGVCYQGSKRVWPEVLGRVGGGQNCGKAESQRSPAERGQVAARIRVRLATVTVR